MMALFAQNPPTPPAISPGAGGGIADRKRPQWTETDVLALPAGEHDEFERKSGVIVGQSNFYQTLGKALSAFATSKGGHLFLGVADNGVIDGAEAKKGNTPTRQWLEQIIPARLDPRFQDFRVHEVIPATPSTIPAGKVVIVIDISEGRVNHQSVEDRLYYHRVGGHSEPAPHAYLEARRARLTQPLLVGDVVRVGPVRAYKQPDHVFVELKIDIDIWNIGPIAATHWEFIAERIAGIPAGRERDIVQNRNEFPYRSGDSGIPVGDWTLYPNGSAKRKQVDLGIRIRRSIPVEIDSLFVDLALEFRVASLVDAGATIIRPLAPFLDRQAVIDSVMRAVGQT